MQSLRWAAGRLRSLAGTIRHLPDAMLHATRRSEARRRIAAARPVGSVLILCHGNICRSPFAELWLRGIMRASATSTVAVSSAGFVGPGRQPPKEAIAVAARRGLDVSGHRSTLLTQPALDAAELVVVMTAGQARALRTRFRPSRGVVLVLGDLDPRPIGRRTIRDPWGCDESVFDASFERIERCLQELKGVLEGQPDSRA